MKKLTLITLITLRVTLLHAADSVKVQNLVPATPPLSAADTFYIIKNASDHTATMDNIADYVNLNIDAATGTIDYLISNGIQSGTAVITNASATALSTTGNIVAGGQGRFAGLYATGKSTLVDASVTAISGTNAIFSNIKGASIDATTGLKTPYLNTAKGNITNASFTALSAAGNIVAGGQGRFGTLYNAGTSSFNGQVNLGGTAANIALASNYLSGDGGDEGFFVDNNGTPGAQLYNQYFVGYRPSGVGTYGFALTYANHTNKLAEFSANTGTGEVRIGGVSSNYFPTFYSNNAEVMRITSDGTVSIGTTSGGKAWSPKLAVSTGSIVTVTSTPAHAIHQLMNYSINNSGFFWDSYFNGSGTVASSALGSFAIYKYDNDLSIKYADAACVGDIISMYIAQKWDASNGTTTISPGNVAVLTIQSASYEVTGAVGNSAAIFDSVAIRSGRFQEGLKAPYKKDIETLDGNPVDLGSIDEVPTIYRYKINPDWAEEKAEKIYQDALKKYNAQKEKEEARVEKEYQEAVAKYEIEMASYSAKVENATGFIKPIEPQKQGIMLQAPVKRVEPVHDGWQEGFIREKLPERYHSPDGGINLSLIAQDALARVAALEKRVEALEERR